MWLLSDIMARYRSHRAWNRDYLGDPPAVAHYCAWEAVNDEMAQAVRLSHPALEAARNRHPCVRPAPWPLKGWDARG